MTATVTEPTATGEDTTTPAEPELVEGQRGTATGAVAGIEGRQVTVRIPYNVRDSHGTSWAPGVFAETLRSGGVIPVVLNHDEGRVVGKVAGYRETADHLELDVMLADPEKVPDASVIKSLLDDGMISGTSFKFRGGVAERDNANKNTVRIRSAHLAHLSFVVDASIPGAKVVGVRNAADIAGVAALVDAGVINAGEGRGLLGLEGDAPTRAATTEAEVGAAVAEALDGNADRARTARTTITDDGLRCARAVDAAVTQACALLDDVDVDALPEGVRDAVGLLVAAGVAAEQLRDAFGFDAPEVLSGDRATDKPYGDVEYADPGYQEDGKKRYPLDTEDHVRAALSYIGQEKNAAKYSTEDLKKVKAKIEAAAKKFGIGERSADDDAELDGLTAQALATLNARR